MAHSGDGDSGVHWVGNTAHWPSSGSITPGSEVWINTESWPQGGAVGGRVVYSTDHGATWSSANLSANGPTDHTISGMSILEYFPVAQSYAMPSV